MTLPKFTALEHLCLLVAAAGAGSKIVSLTPFWGWAIVLGLLIAGASFVIRQGWKPPKTTTAALLILALGLLAVPAVAQAAHYRTRDGWTLQDSSVTPGVVRTVDRQAICTGSTKTVRHTTQATKNAVYAEYGIAHHVTGQYEIDHLIPLELGGADTIANLWPEPAKPVPGFHQKDVLENWLHAQICHGVITADSAQRWIVHDVPGAYRAMVLAKAAAP